MASCFGKRRGNPDKSFSLTDVSVYPPPIRIQKSLVIPGFIREGRQLSRTLSLCLDVEDSITVSDSQSSLDNRLEKLPTKNDLQRAALSFKNYCQDLDLEYDKQQNTDHYIYQKLDLDNESDPILEYEDANSNHSKSHFEEPKNKIAQKLKSKPLIGQASKNVIVNPVNIKPREIKRVNTNLSNNSIQPTSSFKQSDEPLKSSNSHFEDLCFNDYNASNDYIERLVGKKKSIEVLDNGSGKNNIELTIKELDSVSSDKNVNELVKNKPISAIQTNVAIKNSPKDRKRILSTPNEPIIRIDQFLNDELKGKQVIEKTKNRHRTSSLRILAQSVINLMNKRGSKGRGEKKEVKSINRLLNDLEIQSSNASETSSSRQTNSTAGSNSPFIYQDLSSFNESIKNLNNSKKQVSFEMDLKKLEKKGSSRISKRFSSLLGRRKPSNSGLDVQFSKKLSDPKISYPNNDDKTSDYNNAKNDIILLEDGIFTAHNEKIRPIQEFNIPITLLKSESSETLNSNFSVDQRVARTYDMQILTYDQTPIPIPNLPRGRRLQSLENLENCYLVISPKIPNILSLCYCR
ncbi:uncharacterized protein ELE39_003315 [Cryptosporidium sp. chipmunk genotype I]|uniref:uncharacterized protein n=1 Tax=Cryptosporidium sp. chipmunk genotype I TaxID=1280935 RepID=UPI00351A4281|nr:hypothetical protein ELE39_003315 [Cryptosporidium sp. chipmunk genotype I]